VHVAAVPGAARDGLVELDEQPQLVELPHERRRQEEDGPRPAGKESENTALNTKVKTMRSVTKKRESCAACGTYALFELQ
jgi:hypothetical protein